MVFIEFIRGVPLITLLFVASVMLAYFFPPEPPGPVPAGVIMITMFSAAYIAEVIRGGLAALPKGQYEAADSLGLDYAQAMRLIILPQALKISIPGIVNVAVGLFKDTTLVSVISMFDLVGHDPRADPRLHRMERRLLGIVGLCGLALLRRLLRHLAILAMAGASACRPTTVKEGPHTMAETAKSTSLG